jgi:membrane protease YdiL (CAAX protease family)
MQLHQPSPDYTFWIHPWKRAFLGGKSFDSSRLVRYVVNAQGLAADESIYPGDQPLRIPFGEKGYFAKNTFALTWGWVLIALVVRLLGNPGLLGSNPLSLSLTQFALYLSLCVLVVINRHSLADYHFDKLTLLIFVLFRIFPFLGFEPPLILCFEAAAYPMVTLVLVILLKTDPAVKLPPAKFGIIYITMICLILGVVVGAAQMQTYENPFVIKDWSAFIYAAFVYFLDYMRTTAILEETLFRGFLWGILRRSGIPTVVVLIVQAALFSLVHLWKWYSIELLISAFVIGLLQGIIASRTRSLAPAMAFHAATDATLIAIAYVVQ